MVAAGGNARDINLAPLEDNLMRCLVSASIARNRCMLSDRSVDVVAIFLGACGLGVESLGKLCIHCLQFTLLLLLLLLLPLLLLPLLLLLSAAATLFLLFGHVSALLNLLWAT